MRMKIFYQSNRMQKIHNNAKEMLKVYGPDRTKKLQHRLMNLKNATCLADVFHIPGARCHQLVGNRKGQFSVDLDHPYRLLFIPANEPIPRTEDGGIDLFKVTEIEIIGIVDTHEN
jgi:proteic killer suppression protein